MSFDFGSFGNGPGGYVNYNVFKDSQKGGGGKGPSSNSGCLTSVVAVAVFVVLVVAVLAF